MAYDNTRGAGSGPPLLDFGGDNLANPHRAYIWDTGANQRKPRTVAVATVVDGVGNEDGTAGYLHIPGLPVLVMTQFAQFSGSGTQNQIVAGQIYNPETGSGNTGSRIIAPASTTGSGARYLALETYSHGDRGGALERPLWYVCR